MIIIRPLPLTLSKSGSDYSYANSIWSDSSGYALNAVRRWQETGLNMLASDSGGWLDYKCIQEHNANDQIYDSPFESSSYWECLGASLISGGYTWATNVAASTIPTWTRRTRYYVNTEVYDPVDRCLYRANVDMDDRSTPNYGAFGKTHDNLLRPSECFTARRPEIKARWTRIGKANAWAFEDREISSKLLGYDGSSALINPAFWATAGTLPSAVNRLCLAGLANITGITIQVVVNSTITQTITLSYTLATWDSTSTLIIPINTVAAGDNLEISFYFVNSPLTSPPTVGAIGVGYAEALAATEWGVETGFLGFSKRVRDEWGLVTFTPRGSAKTIRATGFLDPSVYSGDKLLKLLALYDGEPVFFDFNPSDTSYDRLRIYGFCTRATIVLQTPTWESVSLEIEGTME